MDVGRRSTASSVSGDWILLTDADTVARESEAVLASYGKGSGHFFNLGHGITPRANPENVVALVETVHKKSQQFHILK